MAIFDLFSKRQKRLRGDVPDVYSYDKLPEALRIQIIHIVGDVLGRMEDYNDVVNALWNSIHRTLTREYGAFSLGSGNTAQAQVIHFLSSESDVERVLDVVELVARAIDTSGRESYFRAFARSVVEADDALEELNARFREHGVGYQYVSGQIIRVDSQLLHAEVVKPTLIVLTVNQYHGANIEYLNAFDHYRHGRYEETLTECLKAFESVMKVICTKRNWAFKQTDTAKKLLDVCFANGLIPDYLQSEFTSIRSALESGVPTARNRQSGHGRGTNARDVPRHLAEFLLHLTASNILFLVAADEAL